MKFKFTKLSVAKYFIVVCFLFCALQSTNAQEYKLAKHLTTSEGLPSNHIYDIAADNEDFLWIATDNGVAKFDGKVFYNYSTKDGLPSNDVIQIAKDGFGNIWANCYRQTPAFYNRKTNLFEPIKIDSTFNVLCQTMLLYNVMPNGSISFGNRTGFIVIDENCKIYFSVNNGKLLGFPFFINEQKYIYVRNADFDVNPGFAIADFKTNKTIIKFKTKIQNSVIQAFSNNSNLFIQTIANSIYILTYKCGKIPFQIDSVSLPKTILNIKMQNDILFAFGADKNVYQLNVKQKKFENLNLNLTANCCFIDKNKQRWLGTLEDGLYCYAANSITTKTLVVALPFKPNFLSIATNKNNELWVGNHHSQVVEISNNTTTIHSIKTNTLNNWLRKIILIKKHIYCVSDNFLVEDFAKKFKCLTNQKFPTSIKCGTALNDSIIILGANEGLFKFNINTKKSTFIETNVYRVVNVQTNNNNAVYFVANNGLGKYDFNTEQYKTIALPKANQLNIIIGVDPDNLVWIASTNGSIVILKNDEMIATIGSEELPQNISSIQFKNNKAWIASKNGLCLASYHFNNNVFNYTLQHISTADGLISNNINDIALGSDSAYLATDNGIAILPLNYKNELYNIQANILTISVNGIVKKIESNYELKTNENNISLSFTGVDLTGHFKNIQYAINDTINWNNMIGSTLNLQLSAGKSIIYYRAMDVNNNVGSNICKIQFTIAQPFYKAAWFLVLIPLLILSLIFIIYFRRKINNEKNIFEKQLAIEQDRNRITNDLHDDIGSTLSSIQLNSSIAEKLMDVDADKAKKLLGKIAFQAKDVIEIMSDIIWSLRAEKEQFTNIESRIKIYVSDLLNASQINYNIEIDAALNTLITNIKAKRNCLLIIKEAVNNIAKYSDATTVYIGMQFENENLKISIEDNGKGFDKAAINLGNGLKNMENRTMELNGIFSVNTSKNDGVTIKISIPKNSLL